MGRRVLMRTRGFSSSGGPLSAATGWPKGRPRPNGLKGGDAGGTPKRVRWLVLLPCLTMLEGPASTDPRLLPRDPRRGGAVSSVALSIGFRSKDLSDPGVLGAEGPLSAGRGGELAGEEELEVPVVARRANEGRSRLLRLDWEKE